MGFAGTALGRALSQCRRTLSCGPQRVPRHQRHSGRTQPPLSPRLQAAAAGARRGAVQVRTASAATVPWQPSAPRLCGTGNARGSERQARRPGPAGCATKECLSTRPPGGTKAAAGPITPITTHFISVPCISPTDARWGRGGRRAPTSTSAQGGTRCDMRSAVAAALALGLSRGKSDSQQGRAGDESGRFRSLPRTLQSAMACPAWTWREHSRCSKRRPCGGWTHSKHKRSPTSCTSVLAKTCYRPWDQTRIPDLEGRAEALAGTFNAQGVANTPWVYATMGREPGVAVMRELEGVRRRRRAYSLSAGRGKHAVAASVFALLRACENCDGLITRWCIACCP